MVFVNRFLTNESVGYPFDYFIRGAAVDFIILFRLTIEFRLICKLYTI